MTATGPITSRRNAEIQQFIDEGDWYLGLHTTAANQDGAGQVEVSANEYARQQVNFGAPSNGLAKNVNEILFPAPVTTGGYGTIVQGGLYASADKVAHPNPQWLLVIPAGSFAMPEGYSKALPAGYITLELRPYSVG